MSITKCHSVIRQHLPEGYPFYIGGFTIYIHMHNLCIKHIPLSISSIPLRLFMKLLFFFKSNLKLSN